jgi:hypothetical protein
MAFLTLHPMARQRRDELARINDLIRLLEGMSAGKNHRGRRPARLLAAAAGAHAPRLPRATPRRRPQG